MPKWQLLQHMGIPITNKNYASRQSLNMPKQGNLSKSMTYRGYVGSRISTKVFVVVLDIKTQTEEYVVPQEHLHSEANQHKYLWNHVHLFVVDYIF